MSHYFSIECWSESPLDIQLKHSQVPLNYAVQYNMMLHTSFAMTGTEHELEFEPAKDTPYLVLMGELWGVFGENFWMKLVSL